MIDEVTPDRVVNARGESDLELRANTVRRSDEHRLPQPRKRAVKHPAKASDFGKRALVESPAREFFNPVRRARRGINVNPRVRIRDRLSHLWFVLSTLYLG